MLLRLFGFLIAGALAAPLSAADEASELKALEGTWKVASIESEGRQAPADAIEKMKWVIRGKEITMEAPNAKAENSRATFTIDSGKSPKEIDVTASGGSANGKTMQGIYELKDNRLKISLRDFASASEGRPTAFEGGKGLALIVLERVENP